MNTKSTAIAHSNTALIKYWGKQNEKLVIPMNNSISLTTSALTTTTTVEFSQKFSGDIFILNEQLQNGKAKDRVINHLNLIRDLTNSKLRAKVISKNNFPTASGLASSASGFAALTLAACSSLNLKKNKKELSMISRRGSGSSCRSIYGGYVEWVKEDENGDSFAIQIADENWFDIRDIVVVLKAPKRKINTRDAMKLSMKTSPYYKSRIENIDEQLLKIRKAIKEKNFTLLGETTEIDCLNLHFITMTSKPTQIFWTPDTLKIMLLVAELRENGIEAYYTIDTGANLHVLTLPKFEKKVIEALKQVKNIEQIIRSEPGSDACLIEEHLF
ncbi:MAG: diphosphomevalonate decarboxylase [Asgard group archaeon]|nr:diphosphomevalonate decarboxylase [Asgard group archaeon]